MAHDCAVPAAPTKEQLQKARARLERLQAKYDVRSGAAREGDAEMSAAEAIERLRRVEARLDARRGGR